MLSQSTIQDLQYFDIICVGNFGAIAAQRIAKQGPQKYKIGVLNFKRKIKQLSNAGLRSYSICITNEPKGVDLIQGNVTLILPSQKMVIVDSNKRLLYKFLIFGEQNWVPKISEHPLQQALSCEFSRVYSSLDSCDSLLKEKGNIIFYVPAGPGNFRQSYPFLNLVQKIEGKNDYHIVILMQGDSFFPNSKQAHALIQDYLTTQGVKIIYNVTQIKVDYLRRVFSFCQQKQKKQLSYSSAYYLIADGVPKILKDSGVDPYACNIRLLHNNQYNSIYILGADNLPTTKSFHASALQLHFTVKNVLQRLKTKKINQKSALYAYNGQTKFKLALNSQQKVEIKHSYSHKSFEITQMGCIRSLVSKSIDFFLEKQFWNFNNYGPPHYLWLPSLDYNCRMIEHFETKENQQKEISLFHSP